jgi:hypothetical protein
MKSLNVIKLLKWKTFLLRERWTYVCPSFFWTFSYEKDGHMYGRHSSYEKDSAYSLMLLDGLICIFYINNDFSHQRINT